MPTYLFVTSIFGTALLIPAIISQAALWQRKEYRWDRIRSYLTSPEGSLFLQPVLLSAYTCIALAWILAIVGTNPAAEVFGWVALLVIAYYHLHRTGLQGMIRPHWTTKALVLIVTIMIGAGLYLHFTLIPTLLLALQLATLQLFLPAIAGVAVLVVNIPFAYRKRQIIMQAAALRQTQSHLTVVGITGSFGKTSTKYFLHHLASEHGERVVATQANHNSYIGVAQDILLELKRQADVYIVEMAAYKPGEVKEIANLAKPAIGIITAIGNQHLELFGNQRNLLAAKWELAQSLPATGTLIINADDPLLVKQAADFSGHIIRYSAESPADIYSDNIVIEATSLFFTLHVEGNHAAVRANLAGKGALSSLLAAVAGAHALKIPFSHIIERLATVSAVPRTMAIKSALHGTTVIDDSYSGGEHAALNAINHLANFPQTDKRIIFVPIIELGHAGNDAHAAIAKAFSQSGAEIFIWGQAYRETIERNFAGDTTKIHWYTNPVRLVTEASSNLTAQSVILLEGRVPSLLQQTLYRNASGGQ